MLILGDGNVTEGLPDSPLWVAIVKILFIVRVVTRPLAPPAETPVADIVPLFRWFYACLPLTLCLHACPQHCDRFAGVYAGH